eukprot:Rmarinus@m.27708
MTSHFFSELNDAEKMHILQQIECNLESEPSFNGFVETASKMLNTRLSSHVNAMKPEVTSQSPANDEHVSLLMQEASEAGVALLTRWPDQRLRLRTLFNQEVAPELRRAMWSAFLSNPAARKEYETRVEQSRLRVISSNDVQITQKCNSVLQEDFPDLSTTDTTMALKQVLSFHHLITAVEDDTHYYLIIPLCYAFGVHDVTQLVEYFFSLAAMERPRCRYTPGVSLTGEVIQPTSEELQLAVDLFDLLQAEDKPLAAHIGSLCQGDPAAHPHPTAHVPSAVGNAAAGSSSTATDSCGASDGVNRARALVMLGRRRSVAVPWQSVFLTIITPLLERCFCGTLSAASTQFVLDQCLLAGFQVLHHFAVVVLLALRDPLIAAKSVAELRRVLSDYGHTIKVATLQKLLYQHFGDLLVRDLGEWGKLDIVNGRHANIGAPPRDSSVSLATAQSLHDTVESPREGPKRIGTLKKLSSVKSSVKDMMKIGGHVDASLQNQTQAEADSFVDRLSAEIRDAAQRRHVRSPFNRDRPRDHLTTTSRRIQGSAEGGATNSLDGNGGSGSGSGSGGTVRGSEREGADAHNDLAHIRPSKARQSQLRLSKKSKTRLGSGETSESDAKGGDSSGGAETDRSHRSTVSESEKKKKEKKKKDESKGTEGSNPGSAKKKDKTRDGKGEYKSENEDSVSPREKKNKRKTKIKVDDGVESGETTDAEKEADGSKKKEKTKRKTEAKEKTKRKTEFNEKEGSGDKADGKEKKEKSGKKSKKDVGEESDGANVSEEKKKKKLAKNN